MGRPPTESFLIASEILKLLTNTGQHFNLLNTVALQVYYDLSHRVHIDQCQHLSKQYQNVNIDSIAILGSIRHILQSTGDSINITTMSTCCKVDIYITMPSSVIKTRFIHSTSISTTFDATISNASPR